MDDSKAAMMVESMEKQKAVMKEHKKDSPTVVKRDNWKVEPKEL